MINNNDLLINAIEGLMVKGYFTKNNGDVAKLIIPECAISVDSHNKIYGDIIEFLIEELSIPLDIVICESTWRKLVSVAELNEFMNLDELLYEFNAASVYYGQKYTVAVY